MFVSQRIGEIHEITGPHQWYYVPSKQNIADDVTKFKIINYSTDSVWLNGPEFLKKPQSTWPYDDLNQIDMENCEEEIKAEFVAVTIIPESSVIPNIQHFSKWFTFLRSTALVLKLVECRFKFKTLRNREIFPNDIF